VNAQDYPFYFTWTSQSGAKPFALTGGDGAWFTTADGSRWLDLGSLSYQVNAGHGRTRIVEAIKRQADELCLSAPAAVFPAKIELATRLLEMAGPGFAAGKVFFTLSGAEANENAIKISRLVTKRTKLISRYRSYHGASMGALTLTGDWRRPPLEPGISGVVHVHDCYCDRCPFGQRLESCNTECAANVRSTMELEGDRTVAAVFLEPCAGSNGVLVPPPSYWPIVRAACDSQGALLVADEVLTGFGRTGKPFAFQHWDVVPDLITVAKGLASGYATIGAVIVHERIAHHFDHQVLVAGLTYYAHPLACAAAVETLKLYEDEKLYENSARLGPILRHELDACAAKIRARSFVRSLGLLAALEIEAEPAAWQTLVAELAKAKLSLHVEPKRGTAIFAPPLCISEADLRTGLRLFCEAAVTAFGAA